MTAEWNLLVSVLEDAVGAQPGELHVQPGEWPQNNPAPLPDWPGLVGSVEFHHPMTHSDNALILFEAADFDRPALQQALEALGWRAEVQSVLRPSGFLTEAEPPRFPTVEQPPHRFLHDGGQAVLTLHWNEQAPRGRLVWRLDTGLMYLHLARARAFHMPELPVLLPPLGAEVQLLSGGGGGSPGRFSSVTSAFVAGGGEAGSVHAHYAAQLQGAGWRRVGESSTSQSVWEDESGTRCALAVQDWPDGRVGVQLLMVREGQEEAPGSWSVTTLQASRSP